MATPRTAGTVAVKRRSVSIPSTVAALAVAVAGAPFIVPAALAVDVVRGRHRFPVLRLWAFAVQYLLLDLFAVVSAALLWLLFGFGRRLDSPRSVGVHGRVQWWWASKVLAAARRTLGLRFEFDLREPLSPGPLLVIGRHCSYGDALLPAVLFGHHHRLQLRYVLTLGLAWVPALDLYGHRLRNHFVNRRSGAGAELLAVGRVARGMSHGDAAVIFPEGRFHTPHHHERAVRRLAEDDPALAARAAGLRHVLPPQPGGVLAMLGAAPTGTDVVLLGHVGFEGFSTMAQLWRNVPLRAPVAVRTWRFAAADIPRGRRERVDWLFDRWEQLDDWIDEELLRRRTAASGTHDGTGTRR
jgi:1-acyl-sn-glycerol-3-phosphate acyltransferase